MTRLFTPKLTLTAEQKAERYTPAKYIALVREVLGTIDLDPASCDAANKVIKANRFFAISDDGLNQSWQAKSLFLNPPYSKMLPWVNKLLTELSIHPKLQAILLANVCTDTEWFKKIAQTRYILRPLICFVEGRIKFDNPFTDSRKENGSEKPSMFVYWGNHKLRFDRLFSQIGHVVEL